MKQTKSLEQCLPVLRGHCIDCFREYSDRATSSYCCHVKDSRARPERDPRRQMSCSGLQHSMEYFLLKGGFTLVQKTEHMRFEKSKYA